MSYFDDHEDEIIWGRYRRDEEVGADPVCKRCGTVCKWGINDNDKWQLFNLSREGSAGNRNVPHQCNPVTADDFEDLS